MSKSPSLVNLCAESLKNYILYGDDDDDYDDRIVKCIYELPTELFDCVFNQLPALALHKFQFQMPIEKRNEFFEYDFSGKGNKRVRCDRFDTAWKALYHLRWPENVENNKVKPLFQRMELEDETVCDWQQKYWEMHIQNCFDAAAEAAMLPSFNQRIGLVELPDGLVKAIGLEQQPKSSYHDYSRLQTHCKELGYYVRCLRLQNVFCNSETCRMITGIKLKELILKRISSKKHVDGLCMILNQHKETLESLELANCKLSTYYVETICKSLCEIDTKMHGIKHFSVKSSKFLEAKLTSLPPYLVTFISSRSLESLCFSDDNIGRNCAKLIFTTLIDAVSTISSLDLSDNNISGWLSDFRSDDSNQGLSSRDMSKCLHSLSVLNLRGNNLRKTDMDDLNYARLKLPVLKNLDLSDNPIEDRGITNLIPYFFKTLELVPIAHLNLKNCKLSISGAIQFLEILEGLNYPITSLSLADNDLGSEIPPALGDFMRTSIKSLDIREIGLGSSGFLELQINMPDVVNLIHIDISENRGGIQAAEFLKDLICRAPELFIVNAGYNLMPSESLSIIRSVLDVRKGKLKLINLLGNSKLCGGDHASIVATIQENGGPKILVPTSEEAPYDDDP